MDRAQCLVERVRQLRMLQAEAMQGLQRDAGEAPAQHAQTQDCSHATSNSRAKSSNRD